MPPVHSKVCPYATIADITRTMRVHAQEDDWDTVLSLAPKYHEAVEALRNLGQLTVAELEERRAYMTEILDNDAVVRRLASPRLDELGMLMTNLQRQRGILRTYYSTPQLPT